MASLPTVKVTARINDQQGNPIAGAVVRMKLTCVEKYMGLVVPREVQKPTDSQGIAVLEVFPNELGSEGSEYSVNIVMLGQGGSSGSCCSCHGVNSAGVVQVSPVRFHVVVPNADCNLFDIVNLPPYEQRGAGAVLTTEVAAYAGQAATSMDTARSYAEAAQVAKTSVDNTAQEVLAAKTATITAQESVNTAAQQMRNAAIDMQNTSRDFESNVVQRTESTLQAYINSGRECVEQTKDAALMAIDARTTDSLNQATGVIVEARTEAVTAVNQQKERALCCINEARVSAKEELNEIAHQYDEDFSALVERAESAAKKSGCSAAVSAEAANRSCTCADRSEAAARGLERHRDDALNAAQRAQSYAECAHADALKAENYGEAAIASAGEASGSATSALKSAQAADAAADKVDLLHEQIISAQQVVAEDREYVENVVGNVRDDVTSVVEAGKAEMNSAITDGKNEINNAVQEATTTINTLTTTAKTVVTADKEAVHADLQAVEQLKQDTYQYASNVQRLHGETYEYASNVQRLHGEVLNAANTASEKAEAAATSATQASNSANSAYQSAVEAKEAKEEAQAAAAQVEVDKQAVADDRVYVDSIKDDAHAAVAEVAAAALTEELKTSAKEQADLSRAYAIKARNYSEVAQEGAVQKTLFVQMGTEFAILSDRVTRLEAGLELRSEDPSLDTGRKIGTDPMTDDRNDPDSPEYFADRYSYIAGTGDGPYSGSTGSSSGSGDTSGEG